MVVGGGNTAIDAARTALRLGAKEVSILYRRTRKEMPAWAEEIDAAEAEGIRLEILAAPTKIEKLEGGLHVTCIRMELGEPDKSGRRSPVPMKGSEHVRVVDNVIAAIGQGVDATMCPDLKLTAWGSIDADPHTGRTNHDKVFAGGDCVTGADIAVTAVGAGRRAAIAMDQFLLGLAVTGDSKRYNHTMGELEQIPPVVVEKFEKKERSPMPHLPMDQRTTTFAEVETGFAADAVREEAQRCLECGCRDAHECRLRTYAGQFAASQNSYAGECRSYARDDSHDRIVYEAHKCIQCGTCVRLTDELLGTSVMGFVGRGFTSRVAPALGRQLAMIDDKGLDIIVENCPVGALTFKDAPVPTLSPKFKR
jgi:formate dehydrogenase major subunit